MKETPIIFSGNHPKLILDGTKTMTRRVMKPQPLCDAKYCDKPDFKAQKIDWMAIIYLTTGWEVVFLRLAS